MKRYQRPLIITAVLVVLAKEAAAFTESPTISATFPPMAWLLAPFILGEFVFFLRRFKRKKKLLVTACGIANLVTLFGMDIFGWMQMALRGRLNELADYTIGMTPLSSEAPRLVDMLYSVTIGSVYLPPQRPEYAVVTAIAICVFLIPTFLASGFTAVVLLRYFLPRAETAAIRSMVIPAKLVEYAVLVTVSLMYLFSLSGQG